MWVPFVRDSSAKEEEEAKHRAVHRELGLVVALARCCPVATQKMERLRGGEEVGGGGGGGGAGGRWRRWRARRFTGATAAARGGEHGVRADLGNAMAESGRHGDG